MTDSSIKEMLTAIGYTAIPLHMNAVSHFELDATVNGIPGTFVLDTGASMTCLHKSSALRFNVSMAPSTEKAGGAGHSAMSVEMGLANTFVIDCFHLDTFQFAVLDLIHVNQALAQRGVRSIDGVLGADILATRAGIIDYAGRTLFLK
jgi:hypothetical protein